MANWDVNNPEDNDIVEQYPANERAHRAAVKSNFGVDHRNTDDANVGKHEVVKLLAQSTPTAAAGQGHFYTKDVGSGVIELFYQDAAGNELRLTSGGKIADNAVVLSSLVDGILTANSAGRAKMADGFVNTAKLLNGLLSADAAGRAKMADDFITAAKMADDSVKANNVTLGTSSGTVTEVTNGSTGLILGSNPTDTKVIDTRCRIFQNSGASSEASLTEYGACNVIIYTVGGAKVKNDSGSTLYFRVDVTYIDV